MARGEPLNSKDAALTPTALLPASHAQIGLYMVGVSCGLYYARWEHMSFRNWVVNFCEPQAAGRTHTAVPPSAACLPMA